MGLFPTSPRAAFLEWSQAHVDIFTQAAAQIGLSPAQVTAFKNAVTDAVVAAGEQTSARLAAENASRNASQKTVIARRVVSETVQTIKTFADNSGNPDAVYQRASLPPPAKPSPVPPPAKPTNITVGLSPTTGAISLSWKASNPRNAAGTSYIIRRKLPNQTAFEFVGVTGTKSFTDSTFTAGPDSVQYTIQGQRSDLAGPVSEIITVNFGRAGGVPSPMTSTFSTGADAEQTVVRTEKTLRKAA